MEEKINIAESAEHFQPIPMDFSIESPAARVEKVKEIIAGTPSDKLTPIYLEKLTDYIIFAMDKEERKQKRILTNNRMITVNKREMSFEGLAGSMESGEDGIYNMIANDKNIIFTPKISITEEDVQKVPGLRPLRESIKNVEDQLKTASGRQAFLLRKQLIEMRQDQYVLKNMYRKPIFLVNVTKSLSKINLIETIGLDEKNEVYSTGLINLYNPKHISTLLCNYSKIKEDCWDKFNSDIKWMMEDLDNLIEETLRGPHPLYYDLLIYKIDGLQNIDIQSKLEETYGIKHSVEYISSLWRNKIPKLLAERAANNWLTWHFTQEEYGKWKKCSRCGQIKLAHNHFFSKNSTSKDGFYSICKECRNKAFKESKEKKKLKEVK